MMNHTQKRIIKESKKLEEYRKKYGSIETYYGLTDNRFKIKRIPSDIDIYEEVFEISFVRSAQSYPLSTILNQDVLSEINDFAMEIIYVRLVMKHAYDYPFKGPVWTLQESKSNIMSNIGIYFEYVLKEHEIVYQTHWTPAIDFEKELLDIIVKVVDGYKYILTTQNNVMYHATEVPRISDLLCAM